MDMDMDIGDSFASRSRHCCSPALGRLRAVRVSARVATGAAVSGGCSGGGSGIGDGGGGAHGGAGGGGGGDQVEAMGTLTLGETGECWSERGSGDEHRGSCILPVTPLLCTPRVVIVEWTVNERIV